MSAVANNEVVDRITSLGERAASGSGIEIVEVQLRGSGKARLLRVYIDKKGGVTHGDCEFISGRLGQLLDDADAVPGDSYTLEVSSPGLDRKLSKPRDFERVIGQKIRVSLRDPIDGLKSLDGVLTSFGDNVLDVETTPGCTRHIPLEQVQKANLKFEW